MAKFDKRLQPLWSRTSAQPPDGKMPLKKQPYGDSEFEIQDPNGYVLLAS